MSDLKVDQKAINDRIAKMILYRERGKLAKSVGLTFEGYLPGASVGSIVRVTGSDFNGEGVDAEVIGFKDKRVILMPLDESRGMSNNSRIILREREAAITVG